MRWKTKQENDIRIKRKFLLIPRSFDGITYWLEWANIIEKYQWWGGYDPHLGWCEIGIEEVIAWRM